MSTINPDERGRRLGMAARPAVFTAAILVQFLAPAIALSAALGLIPSPAPGLLIAIYVVVWCVIGIATLIVPSRRSGHLLAAFMLAYAGGLFAVIQLVDSRGAPDPLFVLLTASAYLAAVVLVILFALRESAMRTTRERGVDTVATVISAPIDGMVNYVPHQRLTLRFTDQQGVERYLRIGRTGGHVREGDQLPLRYDPLRPGSKRSIIVGDVPR